MSDSSGGIESFQNRAWAAFPAASNGEFNIPRDLGVVLARGEGCRVWDTEDREFLDFSMGWGSVLPGHANLAIAEAVIEQAPLGSNFAHVNENSLVLAEELIRLSPACEQVRFCASGTEATYYCQRLAHAFTRRHRLLKFEGAYHGANDVGVTSLFPTFTRPFPQPEPTTDGIADLVEDSVLVAPFNDLETTARIVEAHTGSLAGIIVEPFHRCLSPAPGFLEGLRALCDRAGALLIFDEVVTGFRLAYGGAQEYYGVFPDLVAYGKALGGGYPIGAFGGRREVMEVVREDRLHHGTYVWTASTLGGNPVSCAAALAALAEYRQPETYPRLHALGHYLRDGMRRVLADAGETAQVLGDGPLAQVAFTAAPVSQSRDLRLADRARGRALMLALFARGIFLNPMGTKLYLSMAHDEAVCGAFFARFAEALAATRG